MHSIKRALSAHPSLAASLCSLLAFLFLVILSLAISFNQHLENAVEASYQADLYGQEITDEAIASLVEAKRAGYNNCSDNALAGLRRIQFKTRHIGDIGVLDDNQQLLCSSFLGVLDTPSPAAQVDHVVQYLGHSFGYTYRHPVIIAERRIETALVYYDNLNLVIRPESMKGLIRQEIALLRARTPDGKIATVFENANIDYTTRQLLFKDEFIEHADANTDTDNSYWLNFDPASLSVILTYKTGRIANHPYFYITSISLSEHLLHHPTPLLLLALLYAFVSLLLYRTLKQTFGKWSSLRHRIRSLLQPDNIRCYYQPVIDLRSQKAMSCEVLMRIMDQDELLYPDSFFPLIIEQKLHEALDQAVIARVEQELRATPLPAQIDKIALNFFPETISSGRALHLLRQFLKNDWHFKVNLEVLEQDFHGAVLAQIDAIRQLGITISIDDFGTGYSNLASIKTIAPDYLKVDRSFVQDIDKSTVRSSLVPEIVNIARAVNAETVAEGVEHGEQIPLLQELGIEYAQGYYFAKPMVLTDLISYINSHSAQ